jgi:hypothetical protein
MKLPLGFKRLNWIYEKTEMDGTGTESCPVLVVLISDVELSVAAALASDIHRDQNNWNWH